MKPTKEEQDLIEWGLGNVEGDLKSDQEQLIETWQNIEDIEIRFNTAFGFHEIMDRLAVQTSIFDEYIKMHPVVVFKCEEAYRLLSIATTCMNEAYQVLGKADWNREDAEKLPKS